MTPILTIAVACYNVEQYLDKGLTSYADERLNDRVQVIIVNDGSKDKTQEIAEKYAAKYPKIFQVINKENGGHGSAVNAGIDNAKGKYFRIIDGDDWVNTDNLCKLLDTMEKTDADIIVDNKREVNMVTGDTEYFPMKADVDFDKIYRFEDVCNDDRITPNIMIHTMSIRTSILKENNIHLLEGIFYVDIEFIVKSTVLAKTIQFEDLEVYQYLVGNVNQSVNYKNYVKRYSHHLKVTQELIRFSTNIDCNSKIREYLDKRVRLVVNTHLNIALIYNDNRKEGLSQAKDFKAWLDSYSPKYGKMISKRYFQACVLHALGVNYEKLQKLKSFFTT